MIAGCVTDFDGRYSIKPLDTGRYDVATNIIGYKSDTTKNVLVTANSKIQVNFILKSTRVALEYPRNTGYPPRQRLTIQEIKRMPVTQVVDLIQIPDLRRLALERAIAQIINYPLNYWMIDL
jgi:hypothetical protein